MACSAGVESVAQKLGYKAGPTKSVYEFSKDWMSGDTAARKHFDVALKKAGLGMEDVMAEALSIKIEAFERIDRMLASSEPSQHRPA